MSTNKTAGVTFKLRQVPAGGTEPPPAESARAAGLRYVSDDRAGIRRVRAGKSHRYLTPAGKPVRDPETLARIRSPRDSTI